MAGIQQMLMESQFGRILFLGPVTRNRLPFGEGSELTILEKRNLEYLKNTAEIPSSHLVYIFQEYFTILKIKKKILSNIFVTFKQKFLIILFIIIIGIQHYIKFRYTIKLLDIYN